MIVSPAVRRIFVAAFASFLSLAASPAAAQSNVVAAEVTTNVTAAAPHGLAAPQDEEFAKLFANWEALDARGNGEMVAKYKVNIPSQMPLENALLTSDYGMRTHPVLGGRRNHKGVDLAAPTGTPVYATADGVVERADWFSSYGLFIRIEHGAELETRYAHLSRLTVAAGERVSKGDLIGYVGSTGRSTGPHLHYEVRIANKAVNPMPYMVETQAQQRFALAVGEGGRGGPE
ncbi:M23 family metallopeptidase [Altererythrobacter sp. MF3-039]|uniref:M23 family metallopeptidase n=1 Tax=Altererythrobacter sp. MF3-039 TaxID=3252901 RepID=UPI00390C4266